MIYPKPRIKQLSGRRRNWAKNNNLILTGFNLRNASDCSKYMKSLKRAITAGTKTLPKKVADRMVRLHSLLHLQIIKEMCLPFDARTFPLDKVVRGPSATIDGWEEIHIPTDLRFDSKEQLRELFVGFQFPERMVSKSRHSFTGEEAFLFGLYRLGNAGKYNRRDIRDHFGFTHDSVCSECFGLFLDHMTERWGYLLTNNVAFWNPYFEICAEAIRLKVWEKGCYFAPGSFAIFGFIDNTMNATCRPKGGPRGDGTNAPRNDPRIQEAWYNGWKKLHGMKWQTVDLPNGMTYHAWGAISVRHNDMYSLRHSGINDLTAQQQLHNALQYFIYGDSAYMTLDTSHIRARHNYAINTVRETLENKSMSSCREQIEWDYGEMGRFFPFITMDNVLKLSSMPVKKIYLTAMILRNALNCFRPGITSQYFNLPPPSF